MDMLDIHRLFPGIGGGHAHCVNAPGEPLRDYLQQLGFKVLTLEGSSIVDDDSFFEQARVVFAFPDYFGKNWNAWNDSFNEFANFATGRLAVIWKDADITFQADAQILLRVVSDLSSAALGLAFARTPAFPDGSGEQVQLWVFILGSGPGFRTHLNFPRMP